MKKILYMFSSLLLIFALVIPYLLFSGRTSADVTPMLLQDFEDGGTGGWTSFNCGGAASQTTNTTAAAHSGTHSLQFADRATASCSPSLDITSFMQPGGTYRLSINIMLTAGTDNMKMTIKRTNTSGTAFYDQVNSPVGTSSTSWTVLSNSYTVPSDTKTLKLYVEGASSNANEYLDDVTVDQLSAPTGSGTGTTPDTSGLSANFEDGTTQGWKARIGTETVAVSLEDQHQGTFSLKTSGRQHTYDGPSIDVTKKMQIGSSYHVSTWVKLAPGEADANIRISLQIGYQGATSYKTVVNNTVVSANGWVNLAADYTLSDPSDSISMYMESASGTPSFYMDDFQFTYNQPSQSLPLQDIPSIYQAYASYFPIGAAIEPGQTTGEHSDLLKKHFNSIVAENAMKWDATEPAENTFTFANADIIANFAKTNNMKIRGHNLLWHQQVPAWVFLDTNGQPMTQPTDANKTLLRQRLENHIKSLITHFGDSVYAWDVVNEVIDETQSDGFRHSTWYQILGTEYIDDAFQYARKYAPDAKLYINDYSTTNPTKRQFLFNLVKDMKSRGIPVDGVGHQMHINIASPTPAEIQQTLEMFAGLGVDNQITELDMSAYESGSNANYTTLPQDTAVQQGYRYRDIFNAFKEEKTRGNLTSVTFWGIADDHTWLTKSTRTDFPLLFDSQLQAKPAYWGIVDPTHLPVLVQKLSVNNGTPVIDGADELLWDALSSSAVKSSDGSSDGAVFKTLWDSTHLYVYAIVNDRSVNPSDKVDIYVDGNNGKTSAYQSDDKHYTLFRNGSTAAGVNYRVVEQQAGSYAIEAALPLDAGTVGKQIGFDIRFADADSSRAFSWNDTTSSQDTDTSKYGTLTFGTALKVLDANPGTPNIDGNEDGVWTNVPEKSTDVWVQGSTGATAKFKMMWDAGHLYVYAHITDPLLSKTSANAYEQDSVELFIDQNNHKSFTYEPDDGQYRVNFANEQSYNGAASAANFRTATRVVDDGYIVEASINLDRVQAVNGTLIGFDLQVNDDKDGDGHRDSVVNWSDGSGQSYMNTSMWGVVRLLDNAPPTTTDNAPAGWMNKDVTVALTASDTGSGVAATYYTVDGGAQQQGTSIVIAAEGKHTISYWSVDKSGNLELPHTAIVQIDKTAPMLKVVLDQTILWPPNHQMITVNAVVKANDSLSGIASVALTSITSNEPDNGSGDGNTVSDIQDTQIGTLDTHFKLRAERSGNGNGRIYTITYTAVDNAGNQTAYSATVKVPYNLPVKE